MRAEANPSKAKTSKREKKKSSSKQQKETSCHHVGLIKMRADYAAGRGAGRVVNFKIKQKRSKKDLCDMQLSYDVAFITL